MRHAMPCEVRFVVKLMVADVALVVLFLHVDTPDVVVQQAACHEALTARVAVELWSGHTMLLD